MNPDITPSISEAAIKISISLGVGILVGLERAWAHKEVGVRTFAMTALLGLLGSLLGPPFALVVIIGILLIIAYINVGSLLVQRSLEITTSVALMAVVILGVLVGRGYVFIPVASAVIVTMLLAWKTELARFYSGLLPEEIRSAVLLGLLGFVIYPILPDRFVDRWQLLNPRQAWVTVIVLASIGFLNYVLLRLYSRRGLYYTAVLGGLVNSTATAAELCGLIDYDEGGSNSRAIGIILLTRIAMFVRNLAILFLFAPRAIATALWPLLVMIAFASLIVWLGRERDSGPSEGLKMPLPVSLGRVLRFGALFLGIQVLSTLAERHLGRYGFLMVSLIGGLVSSASTTASAALLASSGRIAPDIAGIAVVLTSMSSALVNLPLVYRQTRQRVLTRRLTVISFGLVLLGLGALLVRERFLH
jgi:uncharacterized membrane protein (DUF4010 family)